MRQISRVDLGLLVLCLSLCVASTVQAQVSGRPAQRPTQQQQQPPARASANGQAPARNAPAANNSNPKREAKVDPRPVFHAPEIPPELDAILKRWEVESAKVKTLHGKQTKTEFNLVFEVEKVTKVDFFFETPDKGRIDMAAVPQRRGE